MNTKFITKNEDKSLLYLIGKFLSYICIFTYKDTYLQTPFNNYNIINISIINISFTLWSTIYVCVCVCKL